MARAASSHLLPLSGAQVLCIPFPKGGLGLEGRAGGEGHPQACCGSTEEALTPELPSSPDSRRAHLTHRCTVTTHLLCSLRFTRCQDLVVN